MSVKKQYAIITKNILIEERVHNWIIETIQTRLQAEEKSYNIRLDKLKQEQERLQAELMGMGELPMFKQPTNKPEPKQQQTNQPTKKAESLTSKLNDEIEQFLRFVTK